MLPFSYSNYLTAKYTASDLGCIRLFFFVEDEKRKRFSFSPSYWGLDGEKWFHCVYLWSQLPVELAQHVKQLIKLSTQIKSHLEPFQNLRAPIRTRFWSDPIISRSLSQRTTGSCIIIAVVCLHNVLLTLNQLENRHISQNVEPFLCAIGCTCTLCSISNVKKMHHAPVSNVFLHINCTINWSTSFTLVSLKFIHCFFFILIFFIYIKTRVLQYF